MAAQSLPTVDALICASERAAATPLCAQSTAVFSQMPTPCASVDERTPLNCDDETGLVAKQPQQVSSYSCSTQDASSEDEHLRRNSEEHGESPPIVEKKKKKRHGKEMRDRLKRQALKASGQWDLNAETMPPTRRYRACKGKRDRLKRANATEENANNDEFSVFDPCDLDIANNEERIVDRCDDCVVNNEDPIVVDPCDFDVYAFSKAHYEYELDHASLRGFTVLCHMSF
jgi:hypothetical protein